MNNWLIALFSGIGGVVITLVVRWFFQWWRRPQLVINFEEYDNQKPYIVDLFMGRMDLTKSNRAKFLRLNVHNAGRSPAMDCEAKMVILKEGKKEIFAPSMHWARRDPQLYKTIDQIYAPIKLNRNDDEPLDIFTLAYHPEENELGLGACIESMSHKVFPFERNVTYLLKVTVYANNTVSKPFIFTLYWDGTLKGFNNAVSKAGKDREQTKLSVSRGEFLTTGIIFFLFSLTLYIYRGNPFVFTAWKFTWHAPQIVSAFINGLQIFILVIGSVISVFCLIGSYSSNRANSFLNMLASHKRLMRWVRDGFIAFFPFAFLINFYVSWIQRLAGIAKNEIVFFIVFAIGFIWTWAIVRNRDWRRS